MSSAIGQSATGSVRLQVTAEFSWLFIAEALVLSLNQKPSAFGVGVLLPACVFAALLVTLNVAFGIYQKREKLSSTVYLLRVCLALLIAAPLALMLVRAMPGGSSSHDQFALSVLFATGGLLPIRHSILFPLLGHFFNYRVMVVGTGTEARVVETSLAAAMLPGTQLVGFYPLGAAADGAVSPRRVLTGYSSIEDAANRLSVDEIIVAVRQQRGGVLPLRSLLACRLNGVRVSDVAKFFEQVHGQVPIESLKTSWLIYGEGYRQDALQRLAKRCFDLVVASLMLVAATPIMAVAALIIKMESPGDVIYRQKRVGLHGREFTVLKLRSMARDAERDGKATWAAANDARITPFGRLMRRARIDELPQLVNVLRGEMSIVGPRPERPEFVATLARQIPFYSVRHSCKPGITGWAQVRFSYGASIEQAARKLEYDLYYVKNHTLFLDMQILLETVRVVLLGEGAR
jgi:sugar transferase (PEP-CTERM system associated)